MRFTFSRLSRVALALALVIGSAEVAAAAQRPDAWVTAKVKIALLTTEGVSGRDVHVDTIDGRVTLHGLVGSDAEKAKAAVTAKGIEGVRDVRNLLQTQPASGKKTAAVADDQLEKNVKAAIAGTPALADSAIRVESVADGMVLLGGRAKTLSDHYAAIDVASRVDGVRGVASQIESPNELADEEFWHEGKPSAMVANAQNKVTDLWITSATKMRLVANSDTPAFDINVDTHDGSVTLFGMVDSTAAKQQAEVEARKVEGVRNVVNDLQVVSEARQDRVAQTDEAVANAIEKRLDQRQTLAQADIHVQVSNGVARLTGKVDSWSEHLTALTLARSTPGVKKVIDDLQVDSPPTVSSR